jgi:hypothetical protein
MALRREKGVWQAIGLRVAIGMMMLWMAGCRTTQSLRVDTPPVQGELVGGGMKIEWTAPANGTAYLIEGTTNRIMETRSLSQGDAYSFSLTSEGQRGEFERILGIKMADARFLLYFQPANSKSPAQ